MNIAEKESWQNSPRKKESLGDIRDDGKNASSFAGITLFDCGSRFMRQMRNNEKEKIIFAEIRYYVYMWNVDLKFYRAISVIT